MQGHGLKAYTCLRKGPLIKLLFVASFVMMYCTISSKQLALFPIWNPALVLWRVLDWSAKAATGGAKKQNANISSPFWTPFLTPFWHIFKTCATFFHVFSRRCSSHAFLVYLCTFSDDFSTHFVCHGICARSDLDCTGMAQTHVLTFERPEKRQKNKT